MDQSVTQEACLIVTLMQKCMSRIKDFCDKGTNGNGDQLLRELVTDAREIAMHACKLESSLTESVINEIKSASERLPDELWRPEGQTVHHDCVIVAAIWLSKLHKCARTLAVVTDEPIGKNFAMHPNIWTDISERIDDWWEASYSNELEAAFRLTDWGSADNLNRLARDVSAEAAATNHTSDPFDS